MGVTLPQLLESLGRLGERRNFKLKDITDLIQCHADYVAEAASDDVKCGNVVLIVRRVPRLERLFQAFNLACSIKSITRTTIALLHRDDIILTYYANAKESLSQALKRREDACAMCCAPISGDVDCMSLLKIPSGSRMVPLQINDDGNIILMKKSSTCFHFICGACRKTACEKITSGEDPYMMYCRRCNKCLH